MHREFKKLLEGAKGVSELIVAVFIDIRGFSSFSKKTESLLVGVFIKQVYKRILDAYFPNSTFFKPTGDGLLIILACDESNVKDVVAKAIAACHKIVQDFSSLCKQDPVVNFPVPDRIGIGVARGPATRLESEGKILDYSGHTLNLAARIMDLARPRGVVLDSSVGIELVPNELKLGLSSTPVFLRGVAETEPVTVYYDEKLTQIPESNKHPLGITTRSVKQRMKTSYVSALLKKETTGYWIRLPSKPFGKKENASVAIEWKGGLRKGKRFSTPFNSFEYKVDSKGTGASLSLAPLMHLLSQQGIKSEFIIVVEYPTTEQ